MKWHISCLILIVMALLSGCDAKPERSTSTNVAPAEVNAESENLTQTPIDGGDMNAASLDDLKQRLYSTDQDISGQALAALIRLGRQATPILLEALTHPTARTRRLAAEGLGEIRDPASADALYQATQDANDEVRARAAGALYALHDPRGLPALVATINDYPNLLRAPYTDSMYPLMQGGEEVLPLIVPLLRSPDSLTRERAFIVLEAVVSHLPQVRDWDTLWRDLGSYDPLGSQIQRDHAAEQWDEWVTQL